MKLRFRHRDLDLRYNARYHIERYLEIEGIFLDCFQYKYEDISFLVDRFRCETQGEDLERGHLFPGPLHHSKSSSEPTPSSGSNLSAKGDMTRQSAPGRLENLSASVCSSIMESYDDSELDAMNCYQTIAGSFGVHYSLRSLETCTEARQALESGYPCPLSNWSSQTQRPQSSRETDSRRPCDRDLSTAGISERFEPHERATLLPPFIPRRNSPKYRRGSKKTVEHEMALLSPGTAGRSQTPLMSGSDTEVETSPEKGNDHSVVA
jgi:hypothetical protein